MIPEKNGIYLRNMMNARNGDIISIPKYAIGDQDNPEGKKINCNWIALEFMNGLAKANAMDAATMRKTGRPEYYNINKLLKYSKTPGVKIFLVNNIIGSDPATEAKLFLKRFAYLTDRSALGGIIVRITSDYTKRTVNSAIVYMEAIKACGMQIGFWGDSSVPVGILKEFISRSNFTLGNVFWNPEERPYTGLVRSYLFWNNLNVQNYIPVVYFYGIGTYRFKPKAVNEYYTSLMQTDINAHMWYCWDPDKKYGPGLEGSMDIRKTLFQSIWTREIVPVTTTPTTPPDPTTPGDGDTTPDPADELTTEQKLAILWQDYLDRSK
ncbi:MAG: hypothetical protein C0391_02010 [Anaerolinea sp.]|nr:hypothetical protein [Anaerolinea sp.]